MKKMRVKERNKHWVCEKITSKALFQWINGFPKSITFLLFLAQKCWFYGLGLPYQKKTTLKGGFFVEMVNSKLIQ
jgi:hypothetical protein